MKELVVLSGKGGAGKTSVAASLAALAGPAALADCDVDAADLHLVASPQTVRRAEFVGGKKARVRPGHCTACGKCEELCRFNAIFYDGPGNGRVERTFRIDAMACEGCGVCAHFCAENAIEFAPAVCGQWRVSETRFGPMVHARLGVGAENSGKLVTLLRRTAREIAVERNLELILCDGSPGIGCPVIASLIGASLALFVTEPTLSALHDFRRVAELSVRLNVPGALAVNKADLNEALAAQIETWAEQNGIPLVGRIPYDPEITLAQIAGQAVVERSTGPAARALRAVWDRLQAMIRTTAPPAFGGLVPLQKEGVQR